jgi:hypothetical protein
MTYGQYIEVQQLLAEDIDDKEKMSKLLGIFFGVADYQKYDSEGVVDFYYYTIAMVIRYALNEKAKLKQPTDKMYKAAAEWVKGEGLGSMEEFKEWATVDYLSQRQGISHDAVLEMRYTTVYAILRKETINRWIEYRITEMMKPKK